MNPTIYYSPKLQEDIAFLEKISIGLIAYVISVSLIASFYRWIS